MPVKYLTIAFLTMLYALRTSKVIVVPESIINPPLESPLT